jgi:hypothetical protein
MQAVELQINKYVQVGHLSQPHMTLPPPKMDSVNQKSTQNISEILFQCCCVGSKAFI